MPVPIPAPPKPDPKAAVLATEDWVEYRTGFPTLVRKFLFRKVPPDAGGSTRWAARC